MIRPERLEPVLEGPRGLGHPGVTITEVKGHGKQKGVTQRCLGAECRVESPPRAKVEAVVLDEDPGEVDNAVVRCARTGSIGGGRIFAYDVADAVRIQAGESGFNAI